MLNDPHHTVPPSVASSKLFQDPPGFRLVEQTATVTFWVGKNSAGETCLVMFLPSFSIPDDDDAFARAVSRGYAAGQRYGATKLIIDLSGNGGLFDLI